ncbi:Anaphase-promoting complex subunit 2 like protein [Verticillium longisporum]|nr:Anaphase-promoting complex subunit 2 like protein [Verticillium longisporum]
MLKDIQDSTRVDTVITRQMQMAEWGQTMLLSYHTKILSRLFWPTLDREHFLLPQPVIEMQSRYDTRYESLKSSRKLTWLNNLGTATVHLDLEDRSIDQECKTYEAAVIYAFQDDGSSTSPVQRTVSQLEDTLQMDDDTIRLALVFWASQRVLREVAPDTYVVLERLEEDTAPAPRDSSPALDDDDVAPSHDTVSPSKTGRGAMDAQEKERRLVYWQFIFGMLTNSAPTMPLGQMAMMMKMLIPDGFPWSNEELQEFLAEKMAEGELELVGGKYRLPRK